MVINAFIESDVMNVADAVWV